MPSSFDLIVIGAGPGGYVCAFRAAQLDLKVALIDKRSAPGGVCLHVGCIPSKALLHSSEQFAFVRDHAAGHGIDVKSVSVDLKAMMKHKATVVEKLTSGVAQLAKARKVAYFHGSAELLGDGKVSVKSDKETTGINAGNIVIATGSAPIDLPDLKIDGKTVVSSDHAIAFDKVPARLAVVGGGAIGLELGSVWSRLGSEVTIVEFLPKIAATFDDDIVRSFARALQKQGLKIETGAKVTGLKKNGNETVLTAERNGEKLEIPTDKVLLAVGRRPYTDELGLEKAGVELDEKKRIRVDRKLRTTANGIWAIGDVVAGPMLAHKAEEDGIAVAEWIAGKAGHINWDLVPSIIYTDPEVAGVGLTEETAREKKIDVKIGKFPFAANGRALSSGSSEGFVKILADAGTDRILGAQILGRGAGELISEVVTHIEYGGSAEDLGRTIHGHPTLSEAVKEAGLAVSKNAIHTI